MPAPSVALPSVSTGHPPAEVDIDERLVRRLLRTQFPDIADDPLVLIGNGWDNVMYRLGDEFVVRLPRRDAAAALILNEQRCLAILAPRLPLPVPVPVHAGQPTHDFRWHWSVCRWFDGERASAAPPHELLDAADTLAAFVQALHTPAPADVPVNSVRGGSHADRLERISGRIEAAGHDGRLVGVRAENLDRLWRELAATPDWTGPPLWLHGDLHGSNILTRDGRINAVIDFGDITGGDPATDLAVAWIVLDEPSRAYFRALVPHDDDTWDRARAWALSFAVFYLDARDDDPVMGLMGDHTLAQVLAT